ncbi:MAG: hypothetical protein ACE5L7_02570, partial [Candidatus Aminicenantales bacterium]
MDKENEHTTVTEADLAFLEEELSRTDKALTLQDLVEKLAFRKTSSQLHQAVKKYDPNCVYEVGDLIYKEYDEALPVSSKGTEHFKGSVVLKVINKIPFASYNCEMLEVGYTGGGTFRKHIDYMEKTLTQVLLPSNYDNKGLKPEILKKNEDPRRNEVPMTARDLKTLEKNLTKALNLSEVFFNWKDFWQLTKKQVPIPDAKIQEIRNHIKDTKKAVPTTELCTRFFGQDPEKDSFALHCLSLNHVLETHHRKDFVFVSPLGWGRWHLREILDSFLKNTALSAPLAKVPSFKKAEKKVPKKTEKFPLKVYLTWREILAGGITIPKSLRKSLADFREYTFTDTESEKDYTVYFYPSSGIFIGLKEFFETHAVPQGASLTLEKKGPGRFTFWLKKSKKKLSVPRLEYDPKKDRFTDPGKEVFTYSLPNKIIHLDKETLQKLISLYDQRNKLDLRELLVLVFNHFGLEGEMLFLHYLRAFHLVDVLKHTTQENVETTLLNAAEFTKSEKKKGIFLFKEKVKAEIEIPEEVPVTIPETKPEPEREELPGETRLAIGMIEEEAVEPEVPEKIVVEEPVEAPVPEPEEAAAPPEILPAPEEKLKEKPKKAPPPKKKKKERKRPEVEAVPRRRKGEKKFIEEKIEIEESEIEALIA